eukprot:1096942-Prymnesium_polylepis.1
MLDDVVVDQGHFHRGRPESSPWQRAVGPSPPRSTERQQRRCRGGLASGHRGGALRFRRGTWRDIACDGSLLPRPALARPEPDRGRAPGHDQR